MTATNHVIAGALIGTAIHNPWLAVPLALLSHFVLDILPHFGLGPNTKLGSRKFLWILGVDLTIASSILLLLLFGGASDPVLLTTCGAVAALPDSIWGYYFYFEFVAKKPKVKTRFVNMLSNIQWAEFPAGMVVEIPWGVLSGLVLLQRAWS